jgi:hypothetical protein
LAIERIPRASESESGARCHDLMMHKWEKTGGEIREKGPLKLPKRRPSVCDVKVELSWTCEETSRYDNPAEPHSAWKHPKVQYFPRISANRQSHLFFLLQGLLPFFKVRTALTAHAMHPILASGQLVWLASIRVPISLDSIVVEAIRLAGVKALLQSRFESDNVPSAHVGRCPLPPRLLSKPGPYPRQQVRRIQHHRVRRLRRCWKFVLPCYVRRLGLWK